MRPTTGGLDEHEQCPAQPCHADVLAGGDEAGFGQLGKDPDLRPQVLGTVLVPALLPVKIASGFLYLLCLPALLRLWPVPPPADRRALPRFNATRALVWFPYCALFTTIFFAPSGGDVLGVARFLGITTGVAILCLLAGVLLARRGAEKVQGLYSRAVTPYAVLVLALVIGTLLLTR